MVHLLTLAVLPAKFGRRTWLETHNLDRVRLTGRAKMDRFASSRRSGESGSRDNEDRVFSGMARAFDSCCNKSNTHWETLRQVNGTKKKAPATAGHQGRSVIDAPSTWLSLVGLLRSIARLRFARQSDYSSAAPVCGQRATKPAKRGHRVAKRQLTRVACKEAREEDTNRSLQSTRNNGKTGIETSVHLPILTRPSLA